MKTKQPLLVISIIFAFSLACQTLAKPFAIQNNASTQTQETISQPTAITLSTKIPTQPASSSDNLPSEITDDSGVSMVLVLEGEFTMGVDFRADSEKPSHQVYLDSYYIDKFEVTNESYKACVDAGVCSTPERLHSALRDDYYGNLEYSNYPVIWVNWNQSKTYCEWRGGQLPTEAQWEKAARGTDERYYPWGDSDLDCDHANYGDCGFVFETAEVDSYEMGKSPYGVYNMIGNVEEWVGDWYSETYYQNSPALNPLGPNSGEERILRGRSWNDFEFLYAARRNPINPSYTYPDVGIRCARTP